jgi:hypothetical protein
MKAPHKPRPKANKPSREELEKLDLDPLAWLRFEALVKDAAKMGHKPHSKPTAKKSEPANGGKTGGKGR